MAELTEYERQRLEHIKRNHEMLLRLGLISDAPSAPSVGRPKGAGLRRMVAGAVAPESLRRSARMRGTTPDYSKELIDTFGEELDRKAERGAKRARAHEDDGDSDGGGEAGARREILESTMAFLREARAALSQFVTSADGEAPATADGWRTEATRRWGDLAGAAGGDKAGRVWEVFVRSRLATPPPPSPNDLLQEYYAHDAWQLLCVCVLMSRVSSWDTKHRCISAFFGAYPTPSAFAQSVVERAETAALRELINSLGLFDDRLRSLTAITTAFLAGADAFDVGLQPPHKIHGVGQFGVDSFCIFARDQGARLKPADAALAGFCNWRRKHAAADDDAAAKPLEDDAAPTVAKPKKAESKSDAKAERSRARDARAAGRGPPH
jgi:methyl-CpG-binding domain protein 4